MGVYIDRKALPKKKEREFFLDDDFNAGWNACLNAIDSIPAADVRPVVRGKWRLYSPLTDTYECDKCGYQVIDEIFRTNFCPNCGADMRESPKEE